MKLAFQNRLALIALGCALPATALAVLFVWKQAPTPEIRLIGVAALIGLWVGCALAVRHQLIFPLQTLASLLEAVRSGDYTLRGRRVAPGDTLGEVVREINQLGDTLQRQRRESLEAAALMQTVLEELDIAVLAFDDAQRLQLANRAAAELVGRSTASMLGRDAAELGLERLLATEANGVTFMAFAGRTGRFEVRQSGFRQGGVPHTLVMVSDLSRALREEERRAWQRLVRVMGHEINNSLAPIKSLAGTLRDMLRRQSCDPDVLESLSLMGDRADSLSRFVSTYSQLARLPAPTKSCTSLNALLNRLVALPAHAGVRVIAPFETELTVDAGQLEQALINLLKNAIEACHGETHRVEMELRRTRESVILEIRDGGTGIANPDNLFVPFFTTKPGGSGIGLALSRQIVEAHGGTLLLENRSDTRGAVARLALPAPPDA